MERNEVLSNLTSQGLKLVRIGKVDEGAKLQIDNAVKEAVSNANDQVRVETENLTAVNTLIDTKRQEIAETKKLIEQQEANLAYLAVKRVSLWVKLGLIAKKVLKLKGKITGKKKTLNGLTDGKDGLDKRLSALENQFNAVLTGVKPVVVATDATEETPKAENNLTNETPEA